MGSRAGTCRFTGPLPLGMIALILASAVILLGACGGDEDDGEGDASAAELSSRLPAGDDLGLDEQGEFDWNNSTDLLAEGLVIPAATHISELSAAVEDAGFQGAAGSELAGTDLNMRIVAAQFDSEDGALEVRDLLHEEDLKQPCPDACVVTPREYELDDIPDSAAVHHVPVRGDLPEGQLKVEAHHAEFVIGPELYVVQADGAPSRTFSAEFDKLMRTVYESASTQ